MEFMNSFLSRLFGSGRQEEEPQPQQEQPVQPVDPNPGPAPPSNQLTLSPSHAVNQLWSLRCKQAGQLPSPLFLLEAPEDLLPAASVRQELARLQLSVNTTANQRLSLTRPKNKGKNDQPQPPPSLDAQPVVFVAASRLCAWLFVYPPVGGGKELDRQMLDQALAKAQVRFGVDEALLDRLPGDPERYFRLFTAALGKPAVQGKDGHVVDLFPRRPERKLVVDEYNRVDYASLSSIQNAEQGDVICRIIPPTQGEKGMTVLGQELPARDGRAATVPKGRNTELAEDGSALLASKTGHVEFNGRTFQVKPVLEIEGNVDFSTGHINFLGDVHVHGDICTGFTVRAMGDITVDGVVEACTVEAGGDLIMVKGAQGDNRAVLRSSHSIFAKYLESCCVYAMENLHADCVINCDVYCDGLVSVRSGRGTIIGGSIRSATEVDASVIGSRAEAHTNITLGGLPCQEFDLELLVREIADLEEELEATELQPDSPTKFTRMSKMRMQLSLNKNKLEQFDKDLEQLRAQPDRPGLRRLTCGIVYPGAMVSIGPAFYRFQQETHPVTAVLDNDEIRII